ncbi:MAG: hypothetical protein AB7D26_11980 [Marinobacterium sp.]
MSAEDILKQAVADILDADSGFGVSAIFQAGSVSPVTLDVYLNLQSQLQPSGMAQTWEIGRTIEYLLADIGREAAVGETFTIGADEYTVVRIESNDGYVVKAVVK